MVGGVDGNDVASVVERGRRRGRGRGRGGRGKTHTIAFERTIGIGSVFIVFEFNKF